MDNEENHNEVIGGEMMKKRKKEQTGYVWPAFWLYRRSTNTSVADTSGDNGTKSAIVISTWTAK